MFSFFYDCKHVNSNISLHIFECVSYSPLEGRMKILSPDGYNFKKLSVLAQKTIDFFVRQVVK